MGCTCGGDEPQLVGPHGYARLATVMEPFETAFPVPDYPPREWFEQRPDWLEPGMKVDVDDEGRVAGYFYPAGGCLVHNHRACPEPSPTRYAAFHQQNVITGDGDSLLVGVIGDVGGHADPNGSITAAMDHYANPAAVLLVGRAYDDEHGGYFLGSMVPETGSPRRRITYGDVALVRRSALSGDWREFPRSWWAQHGVQASVVRRVDGYDSLGPTFVNRPGLPLVRIIQGSAGRVMLGGLGGVQLEEEEPMSVPVRTTTTTVVEEPIGAPGPHQAGAMQAADPPPPSAEGEEEAAAPSNEELAARLDALESTVGEIVAFIEEWQMSQQATARTAVAALPPLPEAAAS